MRSYAEANEYLGKPLKLKHLMATIQQLLSSYPPEDTLDVILFYSQTGDRTYSFYYYPQKIRKFKGEVSEISVYA